MVYLVVDIPINFNLPALGVCLAWPSSAVNGARKYLTCLALHEIQLPSGAARCCLML